MRKEQWDGPPIWQLLVEMSGFAVEIHRLRSVLHTFLNAQKQVLNGVLCTDGYLQARRGAAAGWGTWEYAEVQSRRFPLGRAFPFGSGPKSRAKVKHS